jgi:F-type H+-transporting ATPase subunit a
MIYSSFLDFSALSVGQHWYWKIFGCQVHGQVLATTTFVILVVCFFSIISSKDISEIPDGLQNAAEFITEFIEDIAKTQIGDHDYSSWVPFLGTIFLFILVSNWSGALLPWHIIQIPNGELAAPTNDINTTVSIAVITSIAYFYRGFFEKR